MSNNEQRGHSKLPYHPPIISNFDRSRNLVMETAQCIRS